MPSPAKHRVDLQRISRDILRAVSRPIPRGDFIGAVLGVLLRGVGASTVGLEMWEEGRSWSGTIRRTTTGKARFKITRGGGGQAGGAGRTDAEGPAGAAGGTEAPGRQAAKDAAGPRATPPIGFPASMRPERTARGSLWTGNRAIVPVTAAPTFNGLLSVSCASGQCLDALAVRALENLAPVLAAALTARRVYEQLGERVKELTCLYGIARLAERRDLSDDHLMMEMVKLLPPAYQYPDVASARIVLDDRTFALPDFPARGDRQRSEISTRGERRGLVEVAYRERRPGMEAGPFLIEEQSLIDAVATEIGLLVERREARRERAQLEHSLRHADRLATIGQMAAGVAHELNEPLGAILGFAQLAGKGEVLPEAAARDLDKIVKAAMHAREVVRKMRLFSRQVPPQKTRLQLGRMVDEGLYFLESRCEKAGIELVKIAEPDAPDVLADSVQLHQVLVNLVVNAVQAMPRGGRLTVRTARSGDHAVLVVEDTGIGMTEEVRRRIFTPFFTTKEVGEGTGLGLPVAHGIVTAHGGSIQFESDPGRGTRFEVHLPAAPPEAAAGPGTAAASGTAAGPGAAAGPGDAAAEAGT